MVTVEELVCLQRQVVFREACRHAPRHEAVGGLIVRRYAPAAPLDVQACLCAARYSGVCWIGCEGRLQRWPAMTSENGDYGVCSARASSPPLLNEFLPAGVRVQGPSVQPGFRPEAPGTGRARPGLRGHEAWR